MLRSVYESATPLGNPEPRRESPLLSEHDVAAQLRDRYLIKSRVTLAGRLPWRTLSIATPLPGAGKRVGQMMQNLCVVAVFLPFTFIVGVYGMNFEQMPELAHPLGYPFVWVVMIAVSAAVWSWFRRRGWM